MSETQERSKTAIRLGWTVADFMHEASEGRARRGSAAADAILEKFDVLVKSDKPTQEQIDYATDVMLRVEQDEVRLTNGMVLRVSEPGHADPDARIEMPDEVWEKCAAIGQPLNPKAFKRAEDGVVAEGEVVEREPSWWKFW